MAIDAGEEAAGEVVHEGDGCALSLNGEVNVLMDGRHMAVDEGLGVWTVIGDGVDVYLLELLVPIGFRM